MQMSHQSDIEIEICARDLFKDGQYESPFSRCDEEVRVLDARGDVLEVNDLADGIVREKGTCFVDADGREDAHVLRMLW
jgi:hypothetical protein